MSTCANECMCKIENVWVNVTFPTYSPVSVCAHFYTYKSVRPDTYKSLKYLSMCILLHIHELVYVQNRTCVSECDISDIFTS